MVDYTNAKLVKGSAHQIGKKTNGEELQISSSELDAPHNSLQMLLQHYFLNSITTSEYYNFTSTNDDFALNPLSISRQYG